MEGLANGAVEAASSTNTPRAYASDWKYFCVWCRRQYFAPAPPDPRIVGSISPRKPLRRYRQVERRDHRASAFCAFLELCSARPVAGPQGSAHCHRARWYPQQSRSAAAPNGGPSSRGSHSHAGDLDRGTLRGLRDRAMLLVGYPGGLRRSEIVRRPRRCQGTRRRTQAAGSRFWTRALW